MYIVDNKPETIPKQVSFAGRESQRPTVISRKNALSRSRDKSDVERQQQFKPDLRIDSTLSMMFLDCTPTLKRSADGVYSGVQFTSVSQPGCLGQNQQGYLKHFGFTFFNPQPCPTYPKIWIYELPSYMISSPSSALLYAVRAATLAHYGRRTGNQPMQLEACQWYEKGLESQRFENEQTELRLAQGEDIEEEISETWISAPIMLTLFESVMATSLISWTHHMRAAGKMMELRGPRSCQNGSIHYLFRTVRLTAVSVTIDQVYTPTELCPVVHGNSNPHSFCLCLGRMVHSAV